MENNTSITDGFLTGNMQSIISTKIGVRGIKSTIQIILL